MQRLLLSVLTLSCVAVAQESSRPSFRGGLGFSGGRFDFRTDSRSLDDRTSAAMFLAEFEATTAGGIGGGVRFEGAASDDDLFAGSTNRAQAGLTNVYGHFTYRLQQHRFELPMRVGVHFNGLVLEDQVTDEDVSFASFGPMFEFEPEVLIVRSDAFRWSLYGQMNAGFGFTAVDVDGDPRDYTSSTGFFGVEAGMRFGIGPVRIGVAYIGRFQSMDRSDPEFSNGVGLFVEGYDADYQGILVTGGVVF